jgi:lipopolysaccharide biosynthesis regulator YciM
MNESQIEQMQLGDADLLMRDPDMTIVARLKADPEFAIALYHEQRQRITELETQLPEAVKPKYNCGDYDCPICEFRTLHSLWRYCPDCGNKLNWEW